MSRAAVVSALRELANALEELTGDEWERVGPSLSTLSGASSAAASAVELLPSAPTLGDQRTYVVWSVPGRQELAGIYQGEGVNTWHQVEKRLPNQKLAGSGAQLRRCDHLDQASNLWREKKGNRPAPLFMVQGEMVVRQN